MCNRIGLFLILEEGLFFLRLAGIGRGKKMKRNIGRFFFIENSLSAVVYPNRKKDG